MNYRAGLGRKWFSFIFEGLRCPSWSQVWEPEGIVGTVWGRVGWGAPRQWWHLGPLRCTEVAAPGRNEDRAKGVSEVQGRSVLGRTPSTCFGDSMGWGWGRPFQVQRCRAHCVPVQGAFRAGLGISKTNHIRQVTVMSHSCVNASGPSYFWFLVPWGPRVA